MSYVTAKNFRTTIIAALAIAALGFTTTIPAQEIPAEVTLSDVEGCEHIGSVHGHSGYGRHISSQWEPVAKSRAIRKADNAGATHVVWDRSHGRGVYNGHVYGDMYACE